MTDDDDSEPGSNKFARETAGYYEKTASAGGHVCITGTDLRLAALWARYYASRWQRRAAIAVAFTIVAGMGVGIPDFNGDGRASLADLGAAVRQAAGFTPAIAAPVAEKDS